MTDAAAHPPAGRRLAIGSLESWRKVVLWLLIASAWMVVVEPSPYELIFVLTLLLFLPGGLKVHLASLPFVAALLLYNLGGALALEGATDDKAAVWFIIISFYMAITGLFFCFLLTTSTIERMAVIRSAYVAAAVIASVLGILGYFDVAGLASTLSPMGRAQSTFKDPNVFAPFLIPPFIFLAQDLFLSRSRRPFLAVAAILIIALALFLAFSRGAWANVVVSSILLVMLTLLLAPSAALRRRVVALSVTGSLILGAGAVAALQFPAVKNLFEERASLSQSYDVGETGRFGNQLASIPIILTQPLGMNPRHFHYIFGQDPHNVFLNAFASYGWLGGVSLFALVTMTFYAGWRTIRVRTPWQHHAIAVYAPLVAVLVQGVQIDTDHWRHLYLLLGLMWGMLGATIDYERRQSIRVEASPDRSDVRLAAASRRMMHQRTQSPP